MLSIDNRQDARRAVECKVVFTCSKDLQTCSLESGTATMPMFGSMVQKGKLAAWALLFSQMALKSVDCMAHTHVNLCWIAQTLYMYCILIGTCMSCGRAWQKNTLPTFGRPTMPVFRLMLTMDVLQGMECIVHYSGSLCWDMRSKALFI